MVHKQVLHNYPPMSRNSDDKGSPKICTEKNHVIGFVFTVALPTPSSSSTALLHSPFPNLADNEPCRCSTGGWDDDIRGGTIPNSIVRATDAPASELLSEWATKSAVESQDSYSPSRSSHTMMPAQREELL